MKLCGNSLERQFVQYTAAVSRTRRLTFRQRVGLVESSAMRELHNQIILARRHLEAMFRSMDLDQSGSFILSKSLLFFIYGAVVEIDYQSIIISVLNLNFKEFLFGNNFYMRISHTCRK